MAKKISAKSNPLFLGDKPLDFDDVSADELTMLTPQQKTDKFASEWLLNIHPFTKYRKYFAESEKSSDHIIREVKNYFARYVGQEGWSELKYVMVIDHVLENGHPIIPDTIERSGSLFDADRLPLQMQEKKLKKRKRI